MSKKFLFKFLLGATALAVAVLWLVSMFIEIPVEGGFSIYWVIVVLSGIAGVLFILRGLFSKNVGMLKKLDIIFGAGLLVVTLLAIVQIYAIDNKYIVPVIAIIGTAALLLCVIAVGGKAWDEGNNKKVGYKNYYQRKAEEEKKNKND